MRFIDKIILICSTIKIKMVTPVTLGVPPVAKMQFALAKRSLRVVASFALLRYRLLALHSPHATGLVTHCVPARAAKKNGPSMWSERRLMCNRINLMQRCASKQNTYVSTLSMHTPCCIIFCSCFIIVPVINFARCFRLLNTHTHTSIYIVKWLERAESIKR